MSMMYSNRSLDNPKIKPKFVLHRPLLSGSGSLRNNDSSGMEFVWVRDREIGVRILKPNPKS
jgi:hypothetical protein